MAWLTAHIWIELLIAAFFGGLIGWALRALSKGETVLAFASAASAAPSAKAAPMMASTPKETRDDRKVKELEAQIKAERDELAGVRLKLEEALAVRAKADADDEASMAWRNRYLESRVRFLEGKITDLEDTAAKPPEDKDDEATRLRWRNTYLEGRVRYLEEELVRSGFQGEAPPVPAYLLQQQAPAAETGMAPPRLDGPRNGQGDDLKEIAGVGPKIEQKLNALGIYHFDQIAAWTQDEIDWVNKEISFKGRIEREKWIDQAKALAAGEETDGKRKYLEGRHS
jgi:predicted flap endonuclease-1-like 5' DNA nuclease